VKQGNAPLNVLFIFSDQHNLHRLGCYGDAEVKTPNLDRLASEGFRFDNCYCQSPLCVPSRSSLFAGKYVKNILCYENDCILDTSRHIPFPSILTDGGYRTCVIGKQHINGQQYMGFRQRPYGDIYGQGHQPDPYRGADERQGKSGLGDVRDGGYFALAGPTEIPEFQISENVISYEAVKWLQIHKELHQGEPFFLMLNYPKPHWPYNPPAEFMNLYEDIKGIEDIDPASWEKDVAYIRHIREQWGVTSSTEESMNRALRAYLGCVTHIDDLIGKTIDSLEHLGLLDSTAIVYSTDHGDMAGEHNLWQKGCFYEGSAKVPLIIKLPKGYSAGEVIKSNTGLIDIFPTLLDLCGFDVKEEYQLDGESLVPLMEGDVAGHSKEVYSEIGWLTFAGDAGCMVRDGQLKYNYYLESGHELYDLSNDPGERVNLVQTERYKQTCEDLRQKAESFFLPKEFSDRYRQQLRYAYQKYLHEYSNQYILADGTIIDARP
jgi:choline-sulfatase